MSEPKDDPRTTVDLSQLEEKGLLGSAYTTVDTGKVGANDVVDIANDNSD
ncbi:hypothetical protein [Cellulosimicrobium sp. 22601]